MTSWTFYPVFIGTAVSIIGLSHLAITQHNKAEPHTLSELAAAEQKLFRRFRNILLFCGTLFAITMFGYIAPKLPNTALTYTLCVFVIFGEMISGVIPAKDKYIRIHEVFAYPMGGGMLALSYLFWADFGHGYALAEAVLAITMTILAVLTLVDKKRFVIYELPFIFMSHFSIVIAALAVH